MTSKPTIRDHDALTGITEEREMTDEEYAQYEADIADPEPLPDAE
jgi:hypothetical protein